MTLVGAEDVRRAASEMQSAADSMQRAANQIDSSLDLALRRFEDLVCRLTALQAGLWTTRPMHRDWHSTLARAGVGRLVDELTKGGAP